MNRRSFIRGVSLVAASCAVPFKATGTVIAKAAHRFTNTELITKYAVKAFQESLMKGQNVSRENPFYNSMQTVTVRRPVYFEEAE